MGDIASGNLVIYIHSFINVIMANRELFLLLHLPALAETIPPYAYYSLD